MVCGVRLQDVAEPLMRQIRYLDKLSDELAKGRPMARILRVEQPTLPWVTSNERTRRDASNQGAKGQRHTSRPSADEIRLFAALSGSRESAVCD